MTFIGWSIASGALWGPYWRELRGTGWMYTHDVEATFLVVFYPIVVGLIFLICFSIVAAFRFRLTQNLKVIVGAGIPGLVVFCMLSPPFVSNWTWNYPLSEIIVLIAGLISLRFLNRKIKF